MPGHSKFYYLNFKDNTDSKYDEAIKCYNRAINLDSDHIKAGINKGVIFAELEK